MSGSQALGVVDYQMSPRGEAPAALLDALGSLLDQQGLVRTEVHIIIADSFLRYALIPFSALPLSQAEEQALFLAKFGALYGEMSDWRVVADIQRYGRSRIACAMPKALEEGLAVLCAERELQVKAVTPFFVACWNQARHKIGKSSGMLAVIEREHAVLASIDGGQCVGLRSLFSEGAGEAVDDAVFRERLVHGIDPQLPVWRAGEILAGPDASLSMVRMAAVL